MKLLTLVAAVLFGTLLPNCSADKADWHADARFSPEERAEIVRGVSWLHERAGLPAPTFDWSYEVSGDQPLDRTIRRERGKIGDVAGRGASGLCRSFPAEGKPEGGRAVYLDPVGLPDEHMKLEYLAGLAAHELAHCELGFVDGYHPTDPPTDGIMRVLDPMLWTSAEEKQCRDHADLCPSGRSAAPVIETAGR